MAFLLGSNGYPVTLLVRREAVAECINVERRNPRYFPADGDIRFPEAVRATADVAEALRDCDLCVHAIPVQASRAFFEQQLLPHWRPGTPILSTAKGIEAGTGQFVYELLASLQPPHLSPLPTAFLSGPSFADEMLRQLPTAAVVAARDATLRRALAEMLSSSVFKVFRSSDVVGVEVSGAVKNVIAVAAGISEGLGLGMNATAALVTRGCSEMRRLARRLGARSVTLAGLSGVGDTFMTCFGAQSRNRTVGFRLGRGEPLARILETSAQTAEGVHTARALVRRISELYPGYQPRRLEMTFPVLLSVADVLEGGVEPRQRLTDWMRMPSGSEN